MKDIEGGMMACGLCADPGRFVVETRPMPDAAPPGWALVDIAAIGICGTDYHIFEGKHPFLAYPRVIGHELSGHIVSGPDAGQLVVVNPYLSCGQCRACRRGKPNCCSAIEVLGVHRDGGMCARIAVPRRNLYPADGLTAQQAAMVEFLAIGAHAVARSGAGQGDVVLVTGAGPIGLGTALFARLAGAEVHLTDRSLSRLTLAQTLCGFDRLHGPDLPPLTGALSEGFDFVFDATGNAHAIEAGFPLLAHGGSAVLVSVVKDDITFSDSEFHKREARIIGSRNALKSDFERVMAAMRSGQISADALISQVVALADLPVRFPALVADRESIVKVLVTP
ncbi:zinc-binding alcohol dehydrogenase family protein [Roseinatronobacter alkalisoli]|uniref:Zinc-binding alcohol dehydrogenase family protein n=1 Tax=Roseinatronobacter alkalisoli TaxID=3028235 RepID=A0ABT5TFQ0_9RHOB|nr:zinc-binding alcohol dehydrogenase family protein [Roseinatronobacter sp. HJB301]MDD7973774.1 zinc-binding alcohol dehydrogenase family protein [Roseinatronobacter sp. HJB301]